MSRTLSELCRRAFFAQETDEVLLVLLTLNHADLDEPIRVVYNTVDIVSRGETFSACAFEFTLPNESGTQTPTATLRIDNVDRRIVEAIRSIDSAPTITAEFVLGSTPDTLEATFPDLILKDVSFDPLLVEGSLGYDNITAEPFPGDGFTGVAFEGIFGNDSTTD